MAVGKRREECFIWTDDDYDEEVDWCKDSSSDISRSFIPCTSPFDNNPDYSIILTNSKWIGKREFLYQLKNIKKMDGNGNEQKMNTTGKVTVDFDNQVRGIIAIKN